MQFLKIVLALKEATKCSFQNFQHLIPVIRGTVLGPVGDSKEQEACLLSFRSL